jgi:hypothetical protein
MSDLLLGATNPFVSIPQQPDPLTQLMNIVQNPLSIFNGLGAEGGNPFGQSGDFSSGGQELSPLEKLGLILLASQKGGGTQEAAQPEQEAQPEFPLPDEGKPKGDEPIDNKYKTADGKTKSAKDILDESPICKNLGDQKDIKELKAGAKEKFGDWETEKDPEKAARSAIKFRQLLEYSDNSKSKNGNDRGEEEGNGSLSGVTKDGDIRDGTEASTAINYIRHGRQFVADSTEGGRLKQTNDKYVREDGTTRSDVGQVFVDIGKGISHVIPGLGNVISGAADGIDRGAQKGDIGGALLGGLKGGLNGAVYTATNAMSLMDPTDPKGMIDGAKNLFGGGFSETL